MIRRIFKELWNRFLQQWVIAYNGYDGNIYIMTAKTLPNFDTPRILIAKEDGRPDQKQWYPNIIHKFMGINPQINVMLKLSFFSLLGDRLGDNILHMYWRDFPSGPGKGSVFRKIKFEICENNCNKDSQNNCLWCMFTINVKCIWYLFSKPFNFWVTENIKCVSKEHETVQNTQSSKGKQPHLFLVK